MLPLRVAEPRHSTGEEGNYLVTVRDNRNPYAALIAVRQCLPNCFFNARIEASDGCNLADPLVEACGKLE